MSPAEPPDAAGPRRGVFIVFEGGEGVGKSTQAALLARSVAAQGRTPVLTREPGGSPTAERIRRIILADGSQGLDPKAEALLFAAARADHAAHTIAPALDRGEVVICDRYLESSVAYQGVARGLGAERIRQLSMWATGGLTADITVVLDIDPRIGLARAQDANRLEAESLEFHRTVRAAFLAAARNDPGRHAVIAADRPAEQVGEDVWRSVAPLLGQS